MLPGNRKGLFQGLSPFGQLMAFVLVIIGVAMVTMAFGMLAAMPVWGRDIIEYYTTSPSFTPDYISFLKYYQFISQLGVFILPCLIFPLLIGEHPLSYTRLRTKIDPVLVAYALILMLASLPLINGLITVNEGVKLPSFLSDAEQWIKDSEVKASRLTEAFLGTTTTGGFLVNVLIIAIIPGIGEELLFRGLILRLLRNWFGNVHWAVLVSSALFSALHLQFYGFIPRMVLGILFGYLFIWSGTLWIPILAHMFNNLCAVVAAYLFRKGITTEDYQQLGTAPEWWMYLISVVVAGTLLWAFYRRGKAYPLTPLPPLPRGEGEE